MQRRIAIILLIWLSAAVVPRAGAQAYPPLGPDNAGRTSQVMIVGRGKPNAVAWSPDGATLAVSSSIGLWLYGGADLRAEPRLLPVQTGPLGSVTFSQDGALIAATSDKFPNFLIYVWYAASGEVAAVLGHDEPVYGVAFSPDGALLATGSESMIHLWDVGAWEARTLVLPPEDGSVFSVAFSPDGALLASTTNSGKVLLWDPATGEMVGALEAHTAAASGVVFSPDGSLLASNGLDGRVVLTGVEQLSPQGVIDEAAGGGFAGSIAFASDGATLATGTYGGAIDLWDAVGVRQVGALSGDARPLHSLAYRPDGAALAAASLNGQVRVWDVSSGGLLALLDGYTDGLLSLAYSPGGESLA
ncbi:MAG: WD40 repeat domain-containing protein, partial [Chloroflexi bacterium]|nr:WD40 repeat domain-containing protein [Chloroflexota bacterium]